MAARWREIRAGLSPRWPGGEGDPPFPSEPLPLPRDPLRDHVVALSAEREFLLMRLLRAAP